MTKERARELLKAIWGTPRKVTTRERAEINGILRVDDKETDLEALMRVGEDNFDWQGQIRDFGQIYGRRKCQEHFRHLVIEEEPTNGN